MTAQYSYPVIDAEATGQNIKHLREDFGMTVKEMQSLFDFSSPQAIYKWQHGKTLPTVDEFLVLAHLFKKSIENIIVIGVE